MNRDIDSLPASFKDNACFIPCLLTGLKDGKWKDKIPQDLTGKCISVTDPSIAGHTLTEVITAIDKIAGFGDTYSYSILLRLVPEWFCIDLDNITQDDHIYQNYLHDTFASKSLTEKSVSGNGIHIYGKMDAANRAQLRGLLKRNKLYSQVKFEDNKQVEIFFENRQIVASGDIINHNELAYFTATEVFALLSVLYIESSTKRTVPATIQSDTNYVESTDIVPTYQKMERRDTLGDARKKYILMLCVLLSSDERNLWMWILLALANEDILFYRGREHAFFKEAARVFSQNSDKYNEHEFEIMWNSQYAFAQRQLDSGMCANPITVCAMRYLVAGQLEAKGKTLRNDPDYQANFKRKTDSLSKKELIRNIIDSSDIAMSYDEIKDMVRRSYHKTVPVSYIKNYISDNSDDIIKTVRNRVVHVQRKKDATTPATTNKHHYKKYTQAQLAVINDESFSDLDFSDAVDYSRVNTDIREQERAAFVAVKKERSAERRMYNYLRKKELEKRT